MMGAYEEAAIIFGEWMAQELTSEGSRPTRPSWNSPDNWPEKLREAAEWFDLVDELLESITVEDNATGRAERLSDKLGAGRGIQDDLLRLADQLETEQRRTEKPKRG